jgi:hypothetical protein
MLKYQRCILLCYSPSVKDEIIYFCLYQVNTKMSDLQKNRRDRCDNIMPVLQDYATLPAVWQTGIIALNKVVTASLFHL